MASLTKSARLRIALILAVALFRPEARADLAPVEVRGGHFEAKGQGRLKFLGIEVRGSNRFPSEEKAENLARWFSGAGYNLVVLTHLDQAWPQGVLDAEGEGLEAQAISGLDSLAAALFRRNIYIKFDFTAAPGGFGLEGPQLASMRRGEGWDWVRPEAVAQKAKAIRLLLEHVNPHTGRNYAQEPGVMGVCLMGRSTLANLRKTDRESWPSPWGKDLEDLWHAWLGQRYGDSAALARSWARGSEPTETERLQNAFFAQGMASWEHFAGGGSDSKVEILPDGGPGGGSFLRWTARKPGKQSWHLQIYQSALDLAEAELYTVRFWARRAPGQSNGTKPTDKLAFQVMLDQDPWRDVGFYRQVSLGEDWTAFEFEFRSEATIPGHGRLNISTENHTGTFDLAKVSLRRSDRLGLPQGQSLKQGNVAIPLGERSEAALSDFYRFAMETEREALRSWRSLIREELNCGHPISSAPQTPAELYGLVRDEGLADFVWAEAPWKGPGPLSIAEDGGMAARLSLARREGLPFILGGLRIPSKALSWSAELLPLLGALAAFQDWDGVVIPTAVSGPQATWSLPWSTKAFLEDGILPGVKETKLSMGDGAFYQELSQGREGFDETWASQSVPPWAGAARRLSVSWRQGEDSPKVSHPPAKVYPWISDTGELSWYGGPLNSEKERFLVRAPSIRAALGRIGDRVIGLKDMEIELKEKDPDFSVVLLHTLDGKPLSECHQASLVLMGQASDQGEGKVVTQALEGVIRLPGFRWTAQALNDRGQPARDIEVGQDNYGAVLSLDGRADTGRILLTRQP